MNRLNFLTAGIPLSAKDYTDGFKTLQNMGLNGMELEFVRGVRISEKSKQAVLSRDENLVITSHAPFYVNLNSDDEEKIEASIARIIETAEMTESLGGWSITYHAAYYMGNSAENTFNKVVEGHKKIFSALNNSKIWIRPETTGKKTQWGDIDEIIALSKEFERVLPCVDFSHIYARETGAYNTYDEFCKIFDKVGKNLGSTALENFHAHIAGIEYTQKGERKHLNLEESDFNYKDLLCAFKAFGIKGVIVCESPNIEEDCKLLSDYYQSVI
ncbi:MAG: TIM barrel protein [Candidatus Gastranaerophilales bacterium]|nr:TIM barrel protein [Candidatus Gastranaerophilales bacterium]